MQLVDSMQSDVISLLNGMLHQHAEVYKKIQADGERITKLKAAKVHNYSILRDKYRENFTNAETAIQHNLMVTMDPSLIYASDPKGMTNSHAQRSKDCVKAFDAIKRAYIFEEEYAKSSVEAREATVNFDNDMGIILDALQDMEEKRSQCFRDAAMRFLVYQTSFIRNVQYDIEGIFKTCEDVDPLKDLQEWLSEQKREEEE